jgi:TatD DNase family protein
MELVDSHCHLDVAEFDADRAAVLARARAAGVTRQIVPAIEAATWDGLEALCAREPGLHAAYGLHPLLVARHRDADLDALPDRLVRTRAVAVGECGLDFWAEGLDRERQRAVFRRQLEIARELDLPVVLHARRAVDDVTAALRRVGRLRGVVHSFAGSEEQARQLFRLGFSIGVGGPITYARAKRLRRLVASMPLERLLLETDSPDQPLAGHQGGRNEPAYLVEVLDVVAQLRAESRAAIAAATTANAMRMFGLRGSW